MNALVTRRAFMNLGMTAAGAAVVTAQSRDGQSTTPAAQDAGLQTELLFDIVLDTQPAHTIGSVGGNRIIVPVSGGTFEGPRLKGTVIGPGGDWIFARPDGSSVLDVRLVLQTDDAQKIYVTWRGISHTPQGGTQYARILPVFETGAARYAWLNDILAVGVYRPMPAHVAYRVYRIL